MRRLAAVSLPQAEPFVETWDDRPVGNGSIIVGNGTANKHLVGRVCEKESCFAVGDGRE